MIDSSIIAGYGEATERLRAVVSEAHSIRWFRTLQEEPPPDQVERLVGEHLRGLGPGVPQALEIAWLRGGLEMLHQDTWGIDPYEPWGPRWAGARDAVNRSIADLRDRARGLPEALARIKPPLWPVPGNPVICGSPIVADLAILDRTGIAERSSRDRVVAWGLLCAAESLVWNALLWELLADLIPSPDPFVPLLRLHGLGGYPVGWEGERYTIYRYVP